ncbi:hypothetical protein MBCUT_09130 [Methanobrevibacter cuticularis]|uniref:Uncharacterized protein n=1 Tax=Methanobrevibacter cuticularis TaxID=47311 RepID=A0A166E5G5_9EURY|nr:hypothetical protein [Methanobrevibacter cuticularis]KZX16300.1 hypothetical protein MBCUT_09130 [Methanobrevibacter cuticularis]
MKTSEFLNVEIENKELKEHQTINYKRLAKIEAKEEKKRKIDSILMNN